MPLERMRLAGSMTMTMKTRMMMKVMTKMMMMMETKEKMRSIRVNQKVDPHRKIAIRRKNLWDPN